MDAHKETIIFNAENPQRLDVFLSEYFPERTRSQFQRLIKEECVLINKILPRKSGQLLERGDIVQIYFPPPDDLELQPEAIALDIIFEDENIIVINKPSGMVVHPSAGHQTGTLVHALLNHDQFVQGIGGKKRPGIVHRLDKDTSGVILVAKNENSHTWLQRQFKLRNVEKQYLALVDGHPPTISGRIVAPIYRDKHQRKRMAVAPDGQGKNAETHYHLLKRFKDHTYLEVLPLTGRTHQIRIHLASMGNPICGDRVYGYKKPSIEITRQFLHATKITFRLPGEEASRTFSADLPEELQNILDGLI